MNDDYIEKPDIDVQKRVILESDRLFCGLVDFGQFSSMNSNFHWVYYWSKSWHLMSYRIKIYLTYITWLDLMGQELFNQVSSGWYTTIYTSHAAHKYFKIILSVFLKLNTSCIVIATKWIYRVTP